jgi:transcriptional regulator with XRE-family HTH domain
MGNRQGKFSAGLMSLHGAGWTLSLLAEAMGIHKSFLSRLLAGKRRCERRLRQAARLTGLSIQRLTRKRKIAA